MRKLILLLLSVVPIALMAKGPGETDYSRPRSAHPKWVRLDYGIGAAGCQGSYLPPVDWSQLNPNQPSKPQRQSYIPTLYFELEVRPHERYGVLFHFDRWAQSRWKEQGNHGWHYDSSAETYMVGGRYYWGKRRMLYSGIMGGWSHHWGKGTGAPVVNDVDFAHQLTFVGVRLGHMIAFTAELGQGYKGFLSMGMSMAF